MGGCIKLPRTLLEHPVFTSAPAAWLKVAVAILLKANWRARGWDDGRQGVEIPPGSFVTSAAKMGALARCTRQQYRDAISFLVRTKFVTSKRTNRYELLSVVNWPAYQWEATKREPAEEPPEEPAKNQPRATRGSLDKEKSEEERDTDIDSLPLKKQAAGLAVLSLPSKFGLLKQALTQYMGEEPDDEIVVRTVQAAGPGVSEAEIVAELQILHSKAKHRPGGKAGPRTFGWFPSVIRQRFEQRRAMEERRRLPPAAKRDYVERGVLEEMTGALEIPQ